MIFIDGAMTHRAFGPSRPVAGALADRYTVHIYDRRGRGESANTLPWSEEREIEDIAALLAAAGGQAYAVAVSSGAVLAADAANRLPGITRLALYEPPFIVDGTRPAREATFTADTEALIARGDRTGALTRNAARALSEALPKADYRTLPGQTHMVKAAVLAPAVKDFLGH